MAIDSALPARNAILSLLRMAPAVVELVPKASIYTQWTAAVPAYPLIRMGPPTATPIRATCVDGQTITLAVHAFSQGRREGGALIEPAEDHAGRIGAAIAAALDRQQVAIPSGRLRLRVTGSQLLMDPEESAIFHAVVNLVARAITA